MDRVLHVRGVDLATSTSGGGPQTFVWAHGLTSSRDAENDGLLVRWEELDDVATTLRYDARGHGESGISDDPLDSRWTEMARDQLELAKLLEIDRYVAGGASLGAATAVAAATLAPERISGLVLMIPPTAWDTRAGQVEMYERMATIAEARGVEPLVRAAGEVPPPDPFAGSHAEWRERSARRLRAAGPTRLAAAFRGAGTADLPDPDDIARITVPTLILAWSGDPGHPVSTAERLAELIPNSDLAVASTADDVHGWTDRIAGFLRSVPS